MSSEFSKAFARADNWANFVTGVGASNSRSNAWKHYVEGSLSEATLEGLYNEDAYAARVCDAVPEQCLRAGFDVSLGDTAAEAKLKDKLKTLKATHTIREAWSMARLNGGAIVVVGAEDGQDPSLPINANTLQSIAYLTRVNRREISIASRYEEPLHPDYKRPRTYRINRGSNPCVVHASRVLRFEGASVTDLRRETLDGWGESVLRRPYAQLQQVAGVYASVSSVLGAATEGVLSIQDLWIKIASDQNDELRKRIEVLDYSRSVAKSILIDTNEKYERVETSALQGMSELIGRFWEWLSGACGIPVTILIGQAPAGLNATGDSDLRNFYDRMAVEQTEVLQPQIEKLLRLLLLSKQGPTGGVLPAFEVKWGSFYQPTEEQKQAARKSQADTDNIYLSAGVLRPEEVRKSRFGGGSWSDQTTLLESPEGVSTTDEAGSTGTISPDAADLIMRVTESVCSRGMPRTQGVAVLAHGLGITPEEASALLADSGETYFTTPAPEHTRELDELRSAHAKLQASDRARRTFLERVLAANREGKVWTGFVAAGNPQDPTEGTQEGE